MCPTHPSRLQSLAAHCVCHQLRESPAGSLPGPGGAASHAAHGHCCRPHHTPWQCCKSMAGVPLPSAAQAGESCLAVWCRAWQHSTALVYLTVLAGFDRCTAQCNYLTAAGVTLFEAPPGRHSTVDAPSHCYDIYLQPSGPLPPPVTSAHHTQDSASQASSTERFAGEGAAL
jgi:hypothetical protein